MERAMTEMAQRVAKLEVLADSAVEDRKELKEQVATISSEITELTAAIAGMNQEMARYRGFWGGAMLVIAAIWSFVTLFGGAIWERLQGKG